MLTRLTEDELLASPMEMYLYSLSLHDKLPEILHQAMLLWSYDPSANEYVKLYLSWVETCEQRKVYRNKMEKRMATIKRLEWFNYVCFFIFVATIISIEILKK